MAYIYIFLFSLSILLVYIGYKTRTKGFDNLKVFRVVENNRIVEGESFKITTVIENNKYLPISFLAISEKIPYGITYSGEKLDFKDGNSLWHISKYSIRWFERRRRTYTLIGVNRGTYLIKDMSITIGDIFGFSVDTKEVEDFIEVLVYPKLIPIKKYVFDTTNFNGDNTVKRWIHKDPLYIKGIREYNVEDRMKDIHWKSSLKMNKLMVKDYDYTSERQLILILNIQCHKDHWSHIKKDVIENGVRIIGSLAYKAIKEGIPTGIWTNGRIISYSDNFPSEVSPEINSFKKIMEICARVDYTIKTEFNEYLQSNLRRFERNCTYVVVTPYLDNESRVILSKIKNNGFNVKMIDISDDNSINPIEGIEKLSFKGVNR